MNSLIKIDPLMIKKIVFENRKLYNGGTYKYLPMVKKWWGVDFHEGFYLDGIYDDGDLFNINPINMERAKAFENIIDDNILYEKAKITLYNSNDEIVYTYYIPHNEWVDDKDLSKFKLRLQSKFPHCSLDLRNVFKEDNKNNFETDCYGGC